MDLTDSITITIHQYNNYQNNDLTLYTHLTQYVIYIPLVPLYRQTVYHFTDSAIIITAIGSLTTTKTYTLVLCSSPD